MQKCLKVNKFLKPEFGERYASALTNISLSNKVYKKFGKRNIKNYIQQHA